MSHSIRRQLKAILARESGTVIKDPGGRISVALLYPNGYRAGMSSLGFQGIYGFLNAMPDVVCERAFLPDSGLREMYRRSGTPLLSLETQRPVSDFHIVAFSVAYENDYPNVLRMMQLARIPFRPSERSPAMPLVIMGGVCTAYNPEPLADFMDIVFLGEAETSLTGFMETLRQGSLNRKQLLENVASEPGIYVPSLYAETYQDGRYSGKQPIGNAPAVVQRGQPADLDQVVLNSPIAAPDAEFSDMALVEVMRGCPWSCRFCVASRAYRPVRYRSPDLLKQAIQDRSPAFRKMGLIGPSLSDYPALPDIVGQDVSFSVSSLRAMKKTAGLVRRLAAQGQKSLSIAPEAATARMRKIIKKKLTEQDILETATLVLESGIPQLRLYVMVGLPGETPDDVEAIPELAKRILELSPRGKLVLSVSPFVPKPLTPFQWMPMNRPAELRRKLKRVQAGLRTLPRATISHDSVATAIFEGFLARADRRASRVLESMVVEQGRTGWMEGAVRAGIPVDGLLYEPWDVDAPLPWDFIDAGIPRKVLLDDLKQALKEA